MNSDPSPTGSTAPHRTSNLKGRWKRASSPGVPPPRPAAASASCGEVADISAVRETLTGEHAKGYAQPERPAEPAPVPAPVRAPAPVSPPPREPVTREPVARERPAPPPQRERPAPPPPRPANESRGGQREQYVGLKPDPANDPAPRRLRTENAKPLPVQEYAPSAFARAPDKVVPARASRDGNRESNRDRDRREASRGPADSTSGRPNAVIPAHPSRSKETKAPAKPKSGGIVGFIKRIFSGGRPVDAVGEEIREDRRERRADGDRGRDRDEGEDRSERRHPRHRQGHPHHSRGGRDRSGRPERS
ncbi:MAG TPA: hypothetical protein VHC95_09835 [Opitutales bacterium]|nr:hypothetical protein [Opitutales bacterium]